MQPGNESLMNGVGTVDSYRPLSEIYQAWAVYHGYRAFEVLSAIGDGSTFYYFKANDGKNVWMEQIVHRCNKEMRNL